jgi:rhomboid family GlyGly-CTERM serine protease
MTSRRLDIAPRAYLLPVTVAVLVVVAALGGDALRMAARYDRAAVLDGAFWRLLSAHFVHLGWSHTLLNLAGLGLVWALVGRTLSGWRGAFVLLASIVAIDAGFLVNEPALEWYVGFSGALHGLFAAGVVSGMLEREREAWVLAALLAAKLAWEQLVGPVPLTESMAGGPVIESAHLYGAIGGALAGLAGGRRRAPAIIASGDHQGVRK